MNPPFAAIQWLARDHEEELRREAYRERYIATAFRPERQPGLWAQLVVLLRGRTDTAEPEYDECEATCAEAA